MFVKFVIFYGWPFDFWVHQMTNGTLMLFTFFMITDPMTTPNHRKGRILYALLIALFSFLLSSEWFFYTAPIYVLFGLSLFTPLMDKIWKAKKYEWQMISSSQPLSKEERIPNTDTNFKTLYK